MSTVPLTPTRVDAGESPASDPGRRLDGVARVVGAARAELCQRHDLSVRAVARRAGLQPREVVEHVGTRHELVRRVFFEMAVDAHEAMGSVAPATVGGSCRDRLLAYARGYRHWAAANPVEFALILGPASRTLVDESVAAQGVAWFYGPLLDIFRAGHERGEIDPDAAGQGRALPTVRPGLLAAAQDLDPRLAVAFVTLSTGLHGYLLLEGCGQLGAVYADLDRAFDSHVRALIDAVGVA